jgi:hypothetical protein
MNAKQNTKPEGRADVCIGWFCDYRDKCARHIEANGTVVIRYFQPIKTGEHCEFYTEK